MKPTFPRFYTCLAGCGAAAVATLSLSVSAGAFQGDLLRVEQTAIKVVKISPTDRQKIQHIINLQIRAFQRNDETIAFSYAAPETRKFFGNPRAFMEMVRADYSALYRSDSRMFLEAAVIDGLVIQPLRIVTLDGDTIVALYTMQKQPDNDWRISGCELAPTTLQFI